MKEFEGKVLELLKKDNFVTIDLLCETLNCNRSKLSQTIRGLRKMGFSIYTVWNDVHKWGYRFGTLEILEVEDMVNGRL
jgi:biotin operon repressor